MNCSDARHLIHLDVGDDLRAEEEQQLASHLEGCGECRAYHVSMSSAMSVLAMLRDAPWVPSEREASAETVWPAIAREIQKRQTSPAKARKFNLQVVALSVCSLSLAVVTIVQSLSSMRSSMDSAGFVPGQSVSSQPFPPQYHQSPQFNRTADNQSPNNAPRYGEVAPGMPKSMNTQPQSF